MNETNNAPLTGKYAKLRDDLIFALRDTYDLESTEDGGTCNFDSPVLNLPRWNADKLQRAMREAGARAWRWHSSMWVIVFSSSGQGNRRSRRAEAIYRKLKELGYDAFMYYQMD